VHDRIISAVKGLEFVSDSMLYMILRGRWCHIIALNVHAPTEDRIDDLKGIFYEELQCVFSKFPKYIAKMLFGDFNIKIGMEDIFKQNFGMSLHEISNHNGVGVVNSAK
jgi:hypothetical protein